KLVQESNQRVDQGAEVSRKAGDAFEEIVTSVGRTSASISLIVQATVTQVEASSQVASLITELLGSAPQPGQ
ncbi:hypothetical protein LR393_34730, partial [Kineosporia mesophila]